MAATSVRDTAPASEDDSDEGTGRHRSKNACLHCAAVMEPEPVGSNLPNIVLTSASVNTVDPQLLLPRARPPHSSLSVSTGNPRGSEGFLCSSAVPSSCISSTTPCDYKYARPSARRSANAAAAASIVLLVLVAVLLLLMLPLPLPPPPPPRVSTTLLSLSLFDSLCSVLSLLPS